MSGQGKTAQRDAERGVFNAPWERSFDRILTPFEEFIHRQSTSGLLLMATAVLALVLANSALAGFYQHLVHTPIAVSIGDWRLEKSLQHWVNDGLMALFFFMVGLELKREILVGELAVPRQAALPIVAAIGGMVLPALIYFAINPEGDAGRGWGIPMATDIAFAIGALVLLAHRVPKALITFLVALAIVDDLGAVAVIALFYTDQLVWGALLAGALILAVLVAFNLVGIRHPLPYFLLGVLLWFALLKSGVHATLAGVLTAFTIPARPKYDPVRFSAHVRELMARFDASHQPGKSIMTNDALRAVVQTLENGVHKVEAPLQRLEHGMHLPVAFLVIPVFAFINAGIPMRLSELGTTLTHPVTLGVVLGLLLGKFLGIAGASWLALRLGIGQLPAQTRFVQIAGVALLAGIGFTMAIFIAELGFAGQPEYLLMAKTGVLLASLLAGIGGYLWLWWASDR
ncbi:Na+/H+ antiporter NhaA [Thiohalobacter sp. IOR34]|uniref:Na+/H+ antiporter NhaA n=1 Tax=Thiohalobacter sp. IOR34 TaxID=3057176 RepID=UPI0025B23232|nr:Na+/H+ antiporter NhaA [Thiohalobacter sp. IOR34]WJW74796.1 Na+/H+ antiporter NhaA [Thiohalobacter sp. IOR34]